jgi:hypothetical protein
MDIILPFIFSVIAVIFFVWYVTSKQVNDMMPQEDNTPSKPRIILPSDSKDIYMFTINSPLKEDEWSKILNGGWEYVTCTKEESKEYADWGPEDPSYIVTKFNYVFKRKL